MTQSTQTVLIGWSGVLFVIFNTFAFGLRLPVGKLLADASARGRLPCGRW